MKKYGCAVCLERIEPDDDGFIGQEGVVDAAGEWVWGPVFVHSGCRTDLRTTFDDQIGGPAGFVAAWERVPA